MLWGVNDEVGRGGGGRSKQKQANDGTRCMYLSIAMALPLLAVLFAAALSQAAAAPYTYVALNDSDALCLDGSHYGYFLCRAGDQRWEINLQGGGWY